MEVSSVLSEFNRDTDESYKLRMLRMLNPNMDKTTISIQKNGLTNSSRARCRSRSKGVLGFQNIEKNNKQPQDGSMEEGTAQLPLIASNLIERPFSFKEVDKETRTLLKAINA